MNRKGCPDEYPISLLINGYEMAVFQLTKFDLEDWTYGYLFSEGFIEDASDIASILINEEMGSIHVSLSSHFDEEQVFSKKKHYTAGCGRGVTFFSMTDVKNFDKVTSGQTFKLSYLLKKRSEFAQNSRFYLETGGMHGACIIEEDGSITIREDIGRHNAVDKIIGHALKNRLQPERLILLTTGRVSYEMLSKAAKFGFPVIGSRTAATKQAVQLAKYLNIEVIGYLRGKMATVYTSAGRVENDLNIELAARDAVKGGIN
ncbi:formate dehydrogenase accessory sulfurtransferase FdhD [Neobacillus sp. MM2021_6]|uniref:formate dehydrogenase accessory sulfurtransferase FdhD n=1 Tax=Bacillaceae TaxID=186817 RepID=UPI00140E0CC5|nr:MULTISPECIES: formate dehydrogenase accessory sulfurtransferase FdhD [Bacillaceae]MBO0958530.1 formate dehydrogenase accessory sulfurtransferase FdhD [Neobacillus sp. MM2021_6]NHC18092.1 formate dehydrogenase accessory sulfurtransferase FdhD [Bacillus sp. MM2020_4]